MDGPHQTHAGSPPHPQRKKRRKWPLYLLLFLLVSYTAFSLLEPLLNGNVSLTFDLNRRIRELLGGEETSGTAGEEIPVAAPGGTVPPEERGGRTGGGQGERGTAGQTGGAPTAAGGAGGAPGGGGGQGETGSGGRGTEGTPGATGGQGGRIGATAPGVGGTEDAPGADTPVPSPTIADPFPSPSRGRGGDVPRREDPPNRGSSVRVRLVGRDGREHFPRFRFASGTARLLLDDRRFTPGFYTLYVTRTDLNTGQSETAEQEFAWGVLAMNTDKDRYAQNENAHIDFGVLDEFGEIVCDAELTLVVTLPDGTRQELSTAAGSIRVTGTCGIKEAGLLAPDYETDIALPLIGDYKLELTAVRPNAVDHQTSHMESTVSVVTAAPHVIARTAATRLWPFGPSTMTVDVAFAQEFTGTITDVVPEGFLILDSTPGATLGTFPGTQDVTVAWSGSWSAGTVARFQYTYDAPDISPEFYLVGPLQLESAGGVHAEERRSWQIANDAASSGNYRIVSDVVAAGGGEEAESTNYLLSDTIGEPNIGDGESANYDLNAGYRQTVGTAFIGMSCTTPNNLGTITFSGQRTGSGTCTVTTDNAAGYSLTWAVLTGSGGVSTGSLINENENVIRPYNLSGGLLAHWRLDEITAGEDAYDASGNGNDGTPAGAVGGNNLPQPSTDLPGGTNFKDVRSLDFDGTDDRVETSLASPAQFTWSAWVKPDAFTGYHSIITVPDPNYMLMDLASGSVGSFWSTDGLAGSSLGVTGLSTGTWYHIVFVREGNSTTNGYKVYLNGALTGQANTGTWSSTDPVWIGGRSAVGQYFDGGIDDVRIYNRALTAAEVKALYGEPQSWSVAATAAYWGARLSSRSDDADAKWGTDGSSDKWLPIGDGSYPVVTRTTRTATGGSMEIVEYRAEVGSSRVQATGTYETTVTYTASAL